MLRSVPKYDPKHVHQGGKDVYLKGSNVLIDLLQMRGAPRGLKHKQNTNKHILTFYGVTVSPF